MDQERNNKIRKIINIIVFIILGLLPFACIQLGQTASALLGIFFSIFFFGALVFLRKLPKIKSYILFYWIFTVIFYLFDWVSYFFKFFDVYFTPAATFSLFVCCTWLIMCVVFKRKLYQNNLDDKNRL